MRRGEDVENKCDSLEEYSTVNNDSQSGGGWWNDFTKSAKELVKKAKDKAVETTSELADSAKKKAKEFSDELSEKGNKLFMRKCDEWDCDKYTIDIPKNIQHFLNKLTGENTRGNSVLWVCEDIFVDFIREFGEGEQASPSLRNPGLIDHEFTIEEVKTAFDARTDLNIKRANRSIVPHSESEQFF